MQLDGAALGAGRGDVVRQLLGEILVLALAGGLAGLAIAWAVIRGLAVLGPARLPRLAEVTLDGAVVTAAQEAIAGSEWSIVRAPLDPSAGGVHKISTTDERGIGLQVAGFGNATAFYYPGGMNLELIAPPPTIVK